MRCLGRKSVLFFVTHFASVKHLPSPRSEIRVPDCCVMNPALSGTPRVRNKMSAKKKQAEPKILLQGFPSPVQLWPTLWLFLCYGWCGNTSTILQARCCNCGSLLYLFSDRRESLPCLHLLFFSVLCQDDAFIWVRCQATSTARTTLLTARIRSLLVTRWTLGYFRVWHSATLRWCFTNVALWKLPCKPRSAL